MKFDYGNINALLYTPLYNVVTCKEDVDKLLENIPNFIPKQKSGQVEDYYIIKPYPKRYPTLCIAFKVINYFDAIAVAKVEYVPADSDPTYLYSLKLELDLSRRFSAKATDKSSSFFETTKTRVENISKYFDIIKNDKELFSPVFFDNKTNNYTTIFGDEINWHDLTCDIQWANGTITSDVYFHAVKREQTRTKDFEYFNKLLCFIKINGNMAELPLEDFLVRNIREPAFSDQDILIVANTYG